MVHCLFAWLVHWLCILDILLGPKDEFSQCPARHVPRENMSIKEFPQRDEVMAWIRSCESGDLLPGLCAFVEKVSEQMLAQSTL